MKVSERYYDEIFPFEGTWGQSSKCGLKIVQGTRGKTVIVTELYQDNPGTSVTYAGRKLFEQICAAKGLDEATSRYVECNPDTNSKLSFYDEEYFEVSFDESSKAAYRQLTEDDFAQFGITPVIRRSEE